MNFHFVEIFQQLILFFIFIYRIKDISEKINNLPIE